MKNRNKPMPGEFYRHFKGNLYQILSIATHTESGEELVVYQALYGEFGIFARPISMFMSKVDADKYPEVAAEFRFELFKTQGGEMLPKEELQETMVANSQVRNEEVKNEKIKNEKIKNEEIRNVEVKIKEVKNNIINNEVINNTEVMNNEIKNIEIMNNEINNTDVINTEIANNTKEDSADLNGNVGINPILMEFLDANTFYEKLDIVLSNKNKLNDKIINDMAMSIDCTVMEGDLDERVSSLLFCIQTRTRFESRRLR